MPRQVVLIHANRLGPVYVGTHGAAELAQGTPVMEYAADLLLVDANVELDAKPLVMVFALLRSALNVLINPYETDTS